MKKSCGSGKMKSYAKGGMVTKGKQPANAGNLSYIGMDADSGSAPPMKKPAAKPTPKKK